MKFTTQQLQSYALMFWEFQSVESGESFCECSAVHFSWLNSSSSSESTFRPIHVLFTLFATAVFAIHIITGSIKLRLQLIQKWRRFLFRNSLINFFTHNSFEFFLFFFVGTCQKRRKNEVDIVHGKILGVGSHVLPPNFFGQNSHPTPKKTLLWEKKINFWLKNWGGESALGVPTPKMITHNAKL